MVTGRFLFASILALSQGALGLAASSGASGILSSINTISNECVKLNSTLNSFDDDAQITGTALKLQGEASDLLKDFKNGADEAGKVSSLEPADQEKTADAIVPLSENVVSLINGFVAKKSVFQKAVLGGSADGLVKKDLQDLKEATDSFGQAALKSFSGAPKDKASSVLKEIDEHFADAIKEFLYLKRLETPGKSDSEVKQEISVFELVIFSLPVRIWQSEIPKLDALVARDKRYIPWAR